MDSEVVKSNDKKAERPDIKFAHARRNNWSFFFCGYLDAARKCAQSYLQENKNDSLGIASDYSEFAFVPAFWNFKHAIELALKFIAIGKEKTPQKIKDIEVAKTHNISRLVGKLVGDKKLSSSQASELTEICEKYINLKPLAKLLETNKSPLQKMGYPVLHDSRNMFFKYPEGDKAHNGFEHYLYIDLFGRGINTKTAEAAMHGIMRELQDDSRRLSRLCAVIFNS